MHANTSVTYLNTGLPTRESQGDLKVILFLVHQEGFLDLSTNDILG